ncbi:MAG: hypothetical protein IPP69_17755 [Flavobacteriales bacterium]|nr:hypothetical protein [Flavobacteriales bacterium]
MEAAIGEEVTTEAAPTTTEPTTEPTQKVDEGDALKNNEKPKTLNEKIQYIASKAGVSLQNQKTQILGMVKLEIKQ